MKLFWVTTEDHGEDWFVVATNAEEASNFHEEQEGYDREDATAEIILEIPGGVAADFGWPSDEVLQSCGANLLMDGLTRVVEIGGRRFCEGLMESAIRTTVDDLAEACVFLMNNYNEGDIVNIGTGKDVSIKELAYIIKDIIGFEYEFHFDRTKPDGTPRKLLNVEKINKLGWKAKTDLKIGIELTYKDFLNRFG